MLTLEDAWPNIFVCGPLQIASQILAVIQLCNLRTNKHACMAPAWLFMNYYVPAQGHPHATHMLCTCTNTHADMYSHKCTHTCGTHARQSFGAFCMICHVCHISRNLLRTTCDVRVDWQGHALPCTTSPGTYVSTHMCRLHCLLPLPQGQLTAWPVRPCVHPPPMFQAGLRLHGHGLQKGMMFCAASW